MNVYLVKVRAEYTDLVEVEAESADAAREVVMNDDQAHIIDTMESDWEEFLEVIEVTEA